MVYGEGAEFRGAQAGVKQHQDEGEVSRSGGTFGAAGVVLNTSEQPLDVVEGEGVGFATGKVGGFLICLRRM